MADFHFLRPLWLFALPAGAWLIWRLLRGGSGAGQWRTLVDEALQPFVLAGAETGLQGRNRLLGIGLAAWSLAVVALAGPSWERLPVPAYRSDEALVAVLDLSLSMDAADVQPTRLARAKLKLLSLLERREAGQTALVVFSAHAFTVTPLTSDTRTIAALISSLSTDIMPSRGSYPAAGLDKGAQLLRQAGLSRGELLLITDAQPSPRSLEAAGALRAEGITVHVLAVGTADGGPIPQAGGGFLTDGVGQVVVPRLDAAGLERLAAAGGGRFATLTVDDRDLDYLFAAGRAPGGILGSEEDTAAYRTEIWRDQGVWLILVLLPLVALAFRRGWVAVWAAWLVLPAPEAHALTWTDLWQRRDRQGQEAFENRDHRRASELFDDPQWLAAAQYRAGAFADSAITLQALDTTEAHYNRGNALARAGDLGGAIEAYSRALELDPGHEDARYNRDLLMQQAAESQSQSQQGEPGEETEKGEQPDQSQQSQSSDESQVPESQVPRQGSSPSVTQGEAGESPERDDGERAQAAQQEERGQSPPAEPAAAAEAGGEQARGEQPVPSPADLEEWASEQAAEQWLRRIPEDPGGLLRRKFRYQYQRLGVDQDGNYVWPGDEEQPW
jgi:Ca-activated chloride channel family protein